VPDRRFAAAAVLAIGAGSPALSLSHHVATTSGGRVMVDE